MPDVINLAIGLPVYGGMVVAQATRMWLQLGAALAMTPDRFMFRGITIVDACGVDVSRNRLIAELLPTQANWVLMVDADTWHEDPGDILRMISDADRINCGEAGSVMTGRIAAVAAQVPRRDPNDTRNMVYRMVGDERHIATLGPQLEPIDMAATAMMAINLDFIRAKADEWKPPWFKFAYRAGDVKPVLSEDMYFCVEVDKHDGMILGDGRFRANHLQRPQVIGG